MSSDIVISTPGKSPHWSSWLLFAALFYVVVGLSPFSRSGILDTSGGDTSNQLAWGVMAAVSLAIAANNWADTERLLRRSWPLLLALGWITTTILWAPYQDLSIRRTGALILVAIVGMGLALTCKSPGAFFRTMVVLSGAIMTLNIFGLIALPGLSYIDGAAVGMHPHKNTAGQVSLVAYIVWFVAAATARHTRWRIVFSGGTLLWFGFLVLTQSKTSLGIAVLTPFVMAGTYVVARAQGLVRSFLIAAIIAGFTFVWWVFLGLGVTVERFALLIFGDLTFTGRTDLWEYLWGEVARRPLIGIGYGSFWNTGLRFSPIDLAQGWAATAAQAHNGYLDLILKTGYIGLTLVMLCVVRSLYLAVGLASNPEATSEDKAAYILAVALFIAIALMNFMESSYFRAFHYLSVQFLFLYFFVERWSERLQQEPEAIDDGS